MITFDSTRKTFDSAGQSLGGRYRTHDGKWADSTGAFLVGELERLDQTLNMPLVDVTYTRDIDLREDVTIADDFSSYTLSAMAASGGLGIGQGVTGGKSWHSKVGTQIASVSVDIGKIATPLHLWALELKYTIPELESAAKLGRPIDQQKFAALELKHQLDADAQVYIGDSELKMAGLFNSPLVAQSAALAGASSKTQWANKTPDEILTDITTVIMNAYAASGWAIMPNRILVPPVQFGALSTQKVATAAGFISILRYLEENNPLVASGRGKLQILPCKWCIGAAAGGTVGVPGTGDRLVAYTKQYDFVRFPKTILQRTAIEYEGLYQKTTYYCKLGGVEIVRPETAQYLDLV